MKVLLTKLGTVLALAAVAVSGAAQEKATRKRTVGEDQSVKQKEAAKETAPDRVASQTSEASEKSPRPSDLLPEAIENRRSDASEDEAAILPYYNNYLSAYRLGPEDVISVSVFGQERYSR